MAPSPFVPQKPVKRSLLQRLLGRRHEDGARIEIVNLLARARSVHEVTVADLTRIADAYRIDVRRSLRSELERLYRDYLLHCLEDRRLTKEEVADLDHLDALFGLGAATRDALHRHVARRVYLKSVSEVLSDGTIDEEERAFLERLQTHLGIPSDIAENILEIRERQQRSRRESGPG